jgi:hypothetical protein
MWHAWEISDIHTGVLWVNRKERDNSEDLHIDGRIFLN